MTHSNISLKAYLLTLVAGLTMTACSSHAPIEQPTTPATADATETRTLANQPIDHYDQATRQRVTNWCRLMNVGRSYPEIIKIYKVNDLINQTEYIYDAPQWGKSDYWATPYEILETNKGDCEDFSIAKYYTLRQLGVPEHKLRFMYARSVKLGQAHMVLAYYPNPDDPPLILDSLNKDIKRATLRTDLLPIFSFNTQGMWIAYREGDGKFLGSSSRLNKWQDLQQRMEQHEQLMSYTQVSSSDNAAPPVGMWRCRQISSKQYTRLQKN